MGEDNPRLGSIKVMIHDLARLPLASRVVRERDSRAPVHTLTGIRRRRGRNGAAEIASVRGGSTPTRRLGIELAQLLVTGTALGTATVHIERRDQGATPLRIEDGLSDVMADMPHHATFRSVPVPWPGSVRRHSVMVEFGQPI